MFIKRKASKRQRPEGGFFDESDEEDVIDEVSIEPRRINFLLLLLI
jgi:hypothetical protein